MPSTNAVQATAEQLMRAVVNSGAIRSADQDADLACRIMREELKAFLFDAKYADERALTLTSGSGLAMMSLTAECVRRILAERVTS